MRTQMLGRSALFVGALALLGGAAARAQSPSGYAGSGYPAGYGQGYQAASPVSYGYAGRQAYSNSPGYNNNYYNNYYSQYYAYYYQAWQNYYANQYAQQGAAAPAAAPDAAVPAVPLGPDEIPGDDGSVKKAVSAGPAHNDRFWFGVGYECSWVKPWHLPSPLVTTGSATAPAGVDPATYHPGALGQPTTTVLIDGPTDFGQFSGIRASAGFYLDEADHWAVEGIGFVQFSRSQHFSTASDDTGNPVVARPFFNVIEQGERVLIDAFPGQAAGGAAVDARTQLLGAEVNLKTGCCLNDHVRLGALAGFRFLRLAESLTIRDNLAPVEGGFVPFETIGAVPGDSISDVDSFYTANHFYGFQLGGSVGWEGKWVFVNGYGKVALGATDQEVDINGSSTLHTPAGNQVAGGGLLALPSNIGHHTRNVIGFVPEGGLDFGVKVLPCLRLTAGYSFMYWNAVVRPGAQIDRNVNPSLVPTDATFTQAGMFLGNPQRPEFQFHNETYWIHTLTIGLDFHY
jgi:hypothetical protein